MSDLRFLARRKALTSTAVLTMGLAIGATAASLSVLKAFLFSSLGAPEPQRLVMVQPERDLPGRGAVKFNEAFLNYQLLRESDPPFAELTAALQQSASWEDDGETRQLSAARATASFAATFRAPPMLGRWFEEKEEGPSPAPVIVISHRFWTSHLGADRGVIGKSLSINGAPHTVVGVMPAGFEHPLPTEAWLPFDLPPEWRTRVNGARQLAVFARLRDGATFEAAERTMAAFTARALEFSPDNRDFRHTITTLRDSLLGNADDSALFVLVGAAGLMLLAALNLSSLLVAWGLERQREFAVRVALGAGRSHIMRLVLRQSLMVVGIAGVVGIGLAIVALRVLQSFDLGPTISPFVRAAPLDLAVLAATVVLTLLVGVVASLLPIWFSRAAQVGDNLRATSRSSTLSRGAMRWQQATVLGQSALSVLILAVASLIAVSFLRLSQIPDGFTTRNRLVARVVLPDARFPGHTERAAFGRALHENLAAEPGLVSSGFTTTLPVGDIRRGERFVTELPDGAAAAEEMLLHTRRISPTYFRAMGIPVLRGRAFEAHDDTAAVPVAIVSRALADRLWPGKDAVGERIVRVTTGTPMPLQIVGVVGNTMDGGYDAPPGEAVYVPFAQVSQQILSIVVEGRGNGGEALAALRHALRQTDPVVAAGRVATLDQLVLQVNALPRLRAVILMVFAVVALGIVALGTYAVMSQLVSTREREFALRAVFGARPAQLGRLVITQVMRLSFPGIAVGLVGAWLLGASLRAFLFGVEPTSPAVLTMAGVLLLVLTLAVTVPSAARAMRVNVRRGTE